MVVVLQLHWELWEVWEVTGQIVIENAKSLQVRAVRVWWWCSRVARECGGCVAGCDLRVPA